MEDNIFVQGTIIVILLAYGFYSFGKVFKVYMTHTKAKKEYMNKNKGKYEYVQDFYIWAIVYSVVSILGFIVAIIDLMNQDYMMAAGFCFMGCFCATFVMDSIMKRQTFFDKEGFFFEATYYRYRSVVKMEPRKSVIPSYDMFLTGMESIRISRAMGDKLEEKRKEYRQNKKNK